MRALALALLLGLAGCGVPPALIGAGLGFGASALRLDTVLLSWWIGERTPSPTMPVDLPPVMVIVPAG